MVERYGKFEQGWLLQEESLSSLGLLRERHWVVNRDFFKIEWDCRRCIWLKMKGNVL